VKSFVFTKVLVRAPHVRSFEIAPGPVAGWEVSERAGDSVVQQRHYSDWHRVERVLTRFRREISELRNQGWIEA
jgi:hypothetical protein